MHTLRSVARLCLLLFTFALLLAFAPPTLAQLPVSWWKGESTAQDNIGGSGGTLQGGVGYATGFSGRAFSFDGSNGVVHIPDNDNLKFTGSLTISAYVYAKTYGASPDGSQIFFRGDNRPGYDPYFLDLHPDGTVSFAVSDASDSLANTQSNVTLPLNQWVLITASLDGATGQTSLYFNFQLVGRITTAIRPFHDLDTSQTAGIAIGNTQDPGSYDQAFFGLIDEVRVYNSVVAPAHAWAASHVTAGNGGSTAVLWSNVSGAAFVQTVTANGTNSVTPTFGPSSGQIVRALAVAPDGTLRLLWTNANGTAAVWSLTAAGVVTSYGTSFGPYSGSTATGMTVTADGKTRLLWTNTQGAAQVWTLDTIGRATAYGPTFGPYTGAHVAAIGAGGDGKIRLLWTNSTNAASVWLLDGTAHVVSYGQTYGPYNGAAALAVSGGADGKSRLLWKNSSNAASVWTLNSTGSVLSYGQTYGPYSGASAYDLSVGADSVTRLLWANAAGQASVWSIAPTNGAVTYSPTLGPF